MLSGKQFSQSSTFYSQLSPVRPAAAHSPASKTREPFVRPRPLARTRLPIRGFKQRRSSTRRDDDNSTTGFRHTAASDPCFSSLLHPHYHHACPSLSLSSILALGTINSGDDAPNEHLKFIAALAAASAANINLRPIVSDPRSAQPLLFSSTSQRNLLSRPGLPKVFFAASQHIHAIGSFEPIALAPPVVVSAAWRRRTVQRAVAAPCLPRPRLQHHGVDRGAHERSSSLSSLSPSRQAARMRRICGTIPIALQRRLSLRFPFHRGGATPTSRLLPMRWEARGHQRSLQRIPSTFHPRTL